MSHTDRPHGIRLKTALEVSVIITSLIISIFAANFYLNEKFENHLSTQETANPVGFDYTLEASPSNSTIMQGDSVQLNVTVTYLKGESEVVKLIATGVPEGANYTFSYPQGAPTQNTTFNSTLTIQVPEVVPTNNYDITINAISENGKNYTVSITLGVLSSKVLVYGTINGGAGVMPNRIIFEELSNTGASMQTFAVYVDSWNYSISLPNRHFFAISVDWDNLIGSSGTQDFIMPYGVDAGVGVSSINCPFS